MSKKYGLYCENCNQELMFDSREELERAVEYHGASECNPKLKEPSPERKCCPVMSEQFQFATERFKFTRCTGCGNWAGHYKDGVVPTEMDETEMCIEIYKHLGLVQNAGKDAEGNQQFRMTERGHNFKPDVHPDV